MASSAKQAKKEFDRQMRMMRQQQDREHAWSEQQAQKQMQFQERMSSTAHQREMADLQAAGLNPVLAAGSSGASTPAGSEPSYSSSIVDTMPQMFATLNEALRAARESQRNSARVAYRAQKQSEDLANNELDPDSKNSIYHKKNMENALETYERISSNPHGNDEYHPPEIYVPGKGYVSTKSEVKRSFENLTSQGREDLLQLQRDIGQIGASVGAAIRGNNTSGRFGLFGNMKKFGTVYEDIVRLQRHLYGNVAKVWWNSRKQLARSFAGYVRSSSARERGRFLRQIQNEVDYARYLLGR